MPEGATRASRSARAVVALGASALLVITPLRVVWASDAAGLLGPLVMWLLLVVVVGTTLRETRT